MSIRLKFQCEFWSICVASSHQHANFVVRPGNESLIAAGSWCPNRNELATIRSNIQRNSQRLRDIISAPDFVKFFGEAKPHPNGQRQNIFGSDDELKTAPKGVPKDHRFDFKSKPCFYLTTRPTGILIC